MSRELFWDAISENMRQVLTAFSVTDVGRGFYQLTALP